MPENELTLVVTGATGAVGGEILAVLSACDLPIKELRPLASERSMGSTVEFRGRTHTVRALDEEALAGADAVLFCAGPEVALAWAEEALDAGAVVVDVSGAFADDDSVPLIIPEINADLLDEEYRGLVAVPCAGATMLAMVLHPLHKAAGLKRVVVSSYHAVSGRGDQGMEEMSQQVMALYNQRELITDIFPRQVAFNCFPQVGEFMAGGFTNEEISIARDTRRLLGYPLSISISAAQAPVFYGHCQALNIEFLRETSLDEIRGLLAKAPGVEVVDDPENSAYPAALSCVGSDRVQVGRICLDVTVDYGLNMWIAADNLRRGAALTAVDVVRLLVEKRRFRSLA